MEILGYRRPDGRVGIRNHIAIIPTAVCSSTVAANIAAQIPGAVAIANQHGCCQIGEDYDQTVRTLIGLGKNPNVAAVLVIGLGCEGMPILEIASEIATSGKPVETLVIQEVGGTLKATAEGLRRAGELVHKVSLLRPEKVDISELVLGVECGGSDFTSGLASNPACGIASDLLVAAGGTSMLSETTEFIGAEHILASRCKTPEIGGKLIRYVQECEERAKQKHVNLRGSQPTPGNIEGGISSIEEKSLGCIHKAGHATIQDVLAYGEMPKGKGLYVMDTPGQDVESITGMVAGGCTVIIFTTGRGTPTGCPIAPVIKITGNSRTYKMMEDNMDIDASTIISGEETIEQVGQRILDYVVEVANGHMPKAESLGHREFGIYKIAPTF
jgi:altronate dehydratase large subunit